MSQPARTHAGLLFLIFFFIYEMIVLEIDAQMSNRKRRAPEVDEDGGETKKRDRVAFGAAGGYDVSFLIIHLIINLIFLGGL